MDLERDLFRVTLAGKAGASQEELFETIRALNYTPSLAGGEGFHASEETTHPMGEMPELVRKAIDRAKAESKRFILVDCMGDN